MMKWLIKKFIPSSDTLAGMAAEKIASGINGTGKDAAIAKYSTIANDVANYAAQITAMLKDGKIDTAEQSEIKTMLSPLFDRVMEMVA